MYRNPVNPEAVIPVDGIGRRCGRGRAKGVAAEGNRSGAASGFIGKAHEGRGEIHEITEAVAEAHRKAVCRPRQHSSCNADKLCGGNRSRRNGKGACA